ncbi:MAG TPA: amino acid permease C-terminal domain-containing protein, partial [Terriglobia bacterium]|nr:amino acid permease C-terminal domain-containing protein [Terriglobia bacterium]
PLVPICGMIVSIALMVSLDMPAWIGFGSWLIIGLVIYFSYSRKHSKVQRAIRAGEQSSAISK